MVIQLPESIANTIHHFTGRSWLLPPLLNWLERSHQRYFIITGAPGTGKSAIADWLAGTGSLPADPEASHQLAYLRSQVGATHFCIAASGSTDPRNLAKSIAEQLTHTAQGFNDALIKTLPKEIQIDVKQTVGIANASTITGVHIESLNIGTLSDEASFNRLVRDPLKQLYNDGYSQPILILIDSLDEAETYTGNIKIVHLLTKLTDLPKQIRFLLTTRPDPRILKYFPDSQLFDLIGNAPATSDDIQQYAYEQLSALEESQRSHLASTISRAAEGIFLYAYLVIEDLLPNLSEAIAIETLSLPKGLSGLYQQFLNRELGTKNNEDSWYNLFKPLLGVIAVSQGNGLNQRQLAGIVRKDIEQSLRECAQYLRVAEGHFRVFHKSFADFLLEDENNTNYHISPTTMHQRITDYYWQTSQPLEKVDLHRLDSYAYQHLGNHLMDGDRKDDLCKLLTASPQWMEAKFIHFNDDAFYAADLNLAINSFSDPLTANQLLTLIQLHTARQVIVQRVNRYDNNDLQTLVWLGREAEALNLARLRTSTQKRFWGLFLLYKLFDQSDRHYPSLLRELQETAFSIEKPKARVSALGAVAYTLAQVGCKIDSESIFAQARQYASQIENKSQQSWALKELVISLIYAGCFIDAEEIARTIEDCTWQAWSLATLGASLAINQPEKSKALFLESQEQALTLPDDYEQACLLKLIASALIDANDLDAAEAVAQIINNYPKRIEALSQLGTTLVKAGLGAKAKSIFTDAETLASSIDNDFRQGEALKDLAKAFAQSKHFAEAERIVLTIETDLARTEALENLSVELAQAEQFAESERIAKMIQDKSRWAFVLKALAFFHAKTGNSAVANKLFQEAIAISTVVEDPEISIFALVILAINLKKADCKSESQQIFQEALVAAQSIENDTDQISTLRAVVTELAQQHIFPESEIFAQAIKNPLNRAWAMIEIAISLAQNKCEIETARIFTEIEKLAEIVTNDLGSRQQHKGWVLAELSKALAQVGYFAEAERIAWIIGDTWKQPEAFADLSKALAQDRQFQEAERIARAIPKKEWKQVEALCAIAVALNNFGDEAAAALLIIEARELTKSIEDITWQTWALKTIVTALIQTKQFVEAEAIANEIEDKEKQVSALQELAIASGAPEHFTKARKAIEESVSGMGQPWMLQEIAEALLQLGESTKASELFTAAENAVQNVEPSFRDSALKELSISNAKIGRFPESQRIIEIIDGWMDRDKALIALTRELTQVGMFTEAKQLIQTIEDEKERRWALSSLAIALMRQQRFTEAFNELGTQTPDDFVHILVSSASIFDQLKEGLSLAIFNRTVQIIGWVRSDWRKISSILR
jgi:tetratricopeptide (TPR) repeat protein